MQQNKAETTLSSESQSRVWTAFPRQVWARLTQIDGLNRWQLLAVFLLASFFIFLRDPSLFTNPQFWAEDGKVWYAQAYNGGWLHSLTLPLGGYLNTLQRLSAGLALLVPLRWAPLVMALVGLVCQALPVPILLSSRCRTFGPFPLRLAFAVVYIAIPNAREIHILCTNAHWHLALAELFLAFSLPPRSLFGRIFDTIIYFVGGVCGPFGLLLLPFVFVYWLIRRQRWSLWVCLLLSFGSIVQILFLRHFHETRYVRPLGASVAMFVRLLGGDVFIGVLRGSTPYGLRQPFVVCLAAFVVGLAIAFYCARFVSAEVRLFFLYCCAIFAAALRAPLVPPTSKPLWAAILEVQSLRYWFYPSLPFIFGILWCIMFARSRVMRGLAVMLALVLCQGIWRDWRIPPLEDLHFAQQAAAFEAAPPGTQVTIPLNPFTGEWYMVLTKK